MTDMPGRSYREAIRLNEDNNLAEAAREGLTALARTDMADAGL
jgi:hypothetical protein